MAGLGGAPGGRVDDSGGSYLAYVIFGVLGIVVCAIVVACAFVVIGITSAGDPGPSGAERAAQLRKLPVYWTVRRGDTYSKIAASTGLTVDELQTFNPRVDPPEIQPGQRLKLRAKVPPPKPRPPGPKWATVRTGDSFSSIAVKSGKPVARLRRLNPKLKATALQPGDRVRLR